MTGVAGTVLTFTPNPALDETYPVPALVPGSTHRVPPPHTRAGGKGLNTARVVHQLGHSALAVTSAGGPTGAAFTAELTGSGVPHALLEVSAPTRRSMAFVDAGTGLTSIFNETGVPLRAGDWDELFALVEQALPHAACVVGAGSLPPEAPPDLFARLVRLSAAAGLPCIIDTSGPGLLEAAAAGADVLKPNREELLEATGCDDVTRGADMLISAGARQVLVSSGADGMSLFSADAPGTILTATLGRTLSGNPTGAGDAAVAAVAVLLASGDRDPYRLLRTATAWSAAAVLMPAAGEISPRHTQFAKEVRIQRDGRVPSSAREETV
ncbi:hexose kinase [Arthrobacter koreensis]|uniref:1-phosphofructokinase family hexose kinase n=1 Tax=Arthrobacter koreensis TaxID=199136 RepID=UPI002DBAD13E|nr:hexose kinase [Arthrobacter koreensis]MEB7503850.1 hexose kinase [Arthrobacter koreensis]